MALCSSWVLEGEYCAPCDGDYALDSALLEDYALVASELLYMFSGQQFPGECEETVRPCTASNALSYWPFPTAFSSIYDSGFYDSGSYNSSRSGTLISCGCSDIPNCGCTTLSQIELPRNHITEVSEVKVDGEIVDPSSYRVDEYHFLVRTDLETWPSCQNLRLPDTEPDTFSVTYTYGTPVPVSGRHAAAILACELYIGCNPEAFEGQCRLPRNVVSIVRQGVSVAFGSAFFTPQRGKPVQFGVPEIDAFLAAYNPHGLTAPPVFLSPDDPDLARRVGT